MTKEKYMALADFQTLWTNSIKPYIVAGFIGMLAGSDANAKNLVLADGTNIAQATFIAATEKGANSGVATLDATGKVPSSQLPSFVDDVIEAANFAALPETGEAGKIYVTLDDNKTYRWGGSAYAEISASVALGETQGTAYEGSKGKALKDAFDAHEADTDIHVTAAKQSAWDAKYDKPNTGIPYADLAEGVQDSLDAADSAYQLPSTGMPKSDLAQGVQDSLDLADSAYQKPSTGIAKSDLASDVQASLGKADTALQAADIAGKADKVSSATSGNFAGLDANGNLTDSGSKAADFATAAQGAKADSAIQTVKVNGTALAPDANKAVNVEFEIPERVTAADLATFVV